MKNKKGTNIATLDLTHNAEKPLVQETTEPAKQILPEVFLHTASVMSQLKDKFIMCKETPHPF